MLQYFNMEKPPLPIKTKIAAWWMRFIGIISLIIGIIWIMGASEPRLACERCYVIHDPQYCKIRCFYSIIQGIVLPTLVAFILSSLFFLCSHFIFKKRVWAWISSMALLTVSGIIGLGGFFFALYAVAWTMAPMGPAIFWWGLCLLCISPLIMAILLLLDRKNFWKIAT